VELPPIVLIENNEDLKNKPAGIPYIVGTQKDLAFITVFLEFQILLRSCSRTGIRIKWLDCLKRLGYNRVRDYEITSGGSYGSSSISEGTVVSLNEFIEDKYLVNFDKLSELKILPVWLDDIRTSIETNIIDEVVFNPIAFNKQLGLNVGSSTIKHNMKNLLILDVSSSMPDAVVATITNLAKLMATKFYADVIITGGKSYFVEYDDVINTDIVKLAAKAGRSNESDMFKEILKTAKEYNTVISFGDNDSPGYYMKEKDWNFKINTLYSLHTEGEKTNNVTGYSKGFKPKTTHIVKNWISTIKK
jgi:hypothetical protein